MENTNVVNLVSCFIKINIQLKALLQKTNNHIFLDDKGCNLGQVGDDTVAKAEGGIELKFKYIRREE